MKRLLTVILLVTLIGLFVLPASAQVLWRSAKTMKKGSFIAMTNFYYQSITQTWDTDNEEWCDCEDEKSEWGFNSMLGYAVTDRMEVMAHIPFKSISGEFKNVAGDIEEQEAMGLGDIWLKTRIGVLPWAKDKHGFCITSTLSLPTGNTIQGPDASGTLSNKVKLGSGRIKYALGGIYSSKWFSKYRAHVKLNYWFDQPDYGDNMKLILKNDWNFDKKLMGFATYIMMKKWKDRTAAGVMKPNSHKIRHIAQVGAVYKPNKGVFIRPKVAFIVGGEVGLKYDFKPMIDFWYVFSI